MQRREREIKSWKNHTATATLKLKGRSVSFIIDEKCNRDFSVLPHIFELELESSHGLPWKIDCFSVYKSFNENSGTQ